MTREELKKKISELDEAIEDVMGRLPAHSVKPPVMHELLALEDERALLLKKLQNILC